jgi:cation diffusion facilitator CzcD-associated flavoprotein CzcO
MDIQDRSDKYCIVGAGASGLAAAKNLKHFKVPFDCIERENQVGGLWCYGNPYSAVYKSTHLISSKKLSGFLGYPMPADYPDYPNHEQALKYLQSYAEHFGLMAHIQFNTTVDWIEREVDGKWLVKVSAANGNTETRRYRGVIIANGHLWDPRYPEYIGTFTGETLHARDYRTPDIFRNKRVLVIGGGNSGCDIAVEAGQNAIATFHSTRRGYHYIPKFVFGIPTDQVNEFSVRLRTPRALRRAISMLMIRFVLGNPARVGLQKPDHNLLESHPIINSQLMYYIAHGDIKPKPEVAALAEDKVLFNDGSNEQIDLIVYATGYKVTVPFIDQKHLHWGKYAPDLFLHAFHPEYDNLFIAGLLQPDSGVWWLTDLQCQLIARFIRAQTVTPKRAARFHEIKAGEQPDLRGGNHYIDSARHFHEIDHTAYARAVRRLLRTF